MKLSFFVLLVLVLISCNNSSEDKKDAAKDSLAPEVEYLPVNTASSTDPVTDTLMKLPFIIRTNNYIDSFSNHQHGISFMSDTADGIISVRAGYNGPERFETYYYFMIDIKTKEIKIMDPVEGDHLPLKEYLKNNQ